MRMALVFANHRHDVSRKRPTDATGLFWAFVCLTFGVVLLVAVPFVGIVVIVSAPLCLIDQIVTWRNESRAKRDAIKWCGKYFDPEVGVPLVDFMIALTLHTRCSLECVGPSTELNDIYGMLDDDWIGIQDAEWHQIWLADVFKDARIKIRDLKSFQGQRLEDVIQLVRANAG